MTYLETIDYLYNIAPAFEKVGAGAYKEGLSNTLALDSHFGHPHKSYQTIHIAGTNGKGSCSHTIAAVLQSAGYRTGLYTSPHLVDFRERIKVDGQPIPEQRVIDFVEQERQFFEPLQPSFFELTTALALKYFEEQKVDIAVIEVGLGGRLDCTNIISPILSIITNISFDHTQFLGSTLADIAREKAGIIKSSTPCLIGEYTPETKPVFEAVAQAKHAPLHFAQDNIINQDTCFELTGAYQKKNKNTILNALKLLSNSLKISPEAIEKGLAEVCSITGLQGRWQKLSDHPLVICDTGHNLAGWEYLAPQIKETFEKHNTNNSQLRIVFGMVDDKDVESVLALLPKNATYYFCQARTKRSVSSDKILQQAQKHNLIGRNFASVAQAYACAKAESKSEDFIFIGGSSYVVADLLTEAFLQNTAV